MKFISHWSIQRKLGLLSAFVAVSGAGILAGYSGVHEVVKRSHRETVQSAGDVHRFSELESEYKSAFLYTERFILTGESRYAEEASRAISGIERTYASLKERDLGPELRHAVTGMREFHAGTVVPLLTRMNEAGKSRDQRASGLIQVATEAFGQLQSSLDQAVVLSQAGLNENLKTTSSWQARIRWGFVVLILFGTVGFPLVLLALSRQISRTLGETVKVLKEEVLETNRTADTILVSAQALAQASTEQAAALQQTAASVEEISAMVGKNSENSKRAAGLAQTSQKSTELGALAVEEMVRSSAGISDANLKITEQINSSNQQISEIVTLISEISNKTKVINDIVFQTKLLSFNASVEAARAGEHGKGFAVVAEEVGSLAAMSGKAAREIESMLSSSTEKVTSIVSSNKTNLERLMAESGAKVEEGVQVALKCGEVFSDIVGNVTELAGAADEISTASQEQSHGISEIAKAMTEMDRVTHQNANISSEVSQTIQKLKDQSEKLRGSIGQIEQVVHGRRAGEAAELKEARSLGTASAS